MFSVAAHAPNAAWRKKPATEAQKRWLRDLCNELDGECDEEWLQALTAGEASKEIDARKDKVMQK